MPPLQPPPTGWRGLPSAVGARLAFGGAWACRSLRVPSRWLPQRARARVRHWDGSMLRRLAASGGRSAYADAPCHFVPPDDPAAPRAEVAPEHRMTAGELRAFWQRGFTEPFDVFTPGQMADFRRDLLEAVRRPSQTYGFATPRDRHFELPRLWYYLRSPAMTDRIAQLLGPDLLCWRSEVLQSSAGGAGGAWRQASTHLAGSAMAPALAPPDRGPLFEVTAYVAIDDADEDSACLRFVAGSHDRIRTADAVGGAWRLDMSASDADVVELPCRAGQAVLFTERCVHALAPNRTDRRRLAIGARLVTPEVAVYPGERRVSRGPGRPPYFLDNWGVAVVRGVDRLRLSRSAAPELLDRGAAFAVGRAA